MTYPHPKKPYAVRTWYAIEEDDGRSKDEIRAWLNLGMKKVESRHGVKVERRRMYRRKSLTGSRKMWWQMEGKSYEFDA